MSVSVRSFLIPATAGVLALTPSLMAPAAGPVGSPQLPGASLPTVHAAEIQLAGIGRDIYDEITVFVQYTVTSAQYWIDLLPVIGPPLAEQLGINYFDLIQPAVASTVYYLSDLIENPASFVQLTANYGANLYYAGYTWASSQAEFFGFPPLPPIPAPAPLLAAAEAPAPAQSVAAPGRRAAAAAPSAEVTAAESEPAVEAVAEAVVEAAEPVAAAPEAGIAEFGRAARSVVRSARQSMRADVPATVSARVSAAEARAARVPVRRGAAAGRAADARAASTSAPDAQGAAADGGTAN